MPCSSFITIIAIIVMVHHIQHTLLFRIYKLLSRLMPSSEHYRVYQIIEICHCFLNERGTEYFACSKIRKYDSTIDSIFKSCFSQIPICN